MIKKLLRKLGLGSRPKNREDAELLRRSGTFAAQHAASRPGSRPKSTSGHPNAVRSKRKPSPQTPESADARSGTDRRVKNADRRTENRVENKSAGKNALVRKKYVREDTGTHETLTILDDSMLDFGEEEGIDPYNTGRFDRSKNWDKRRN